MPKPKLRKRESRKASEYCLVAMMGKVIEAGSIAKGAAALIKGGDYERAFQAGLQIEPLLRDADQALQSVSIFRRLAQEEDA